MDHNTAIAAITRDAIAAIRALTSEAMTRLQGHATTSLVPMQQTDFTEVEQRALEQIARASVPTEADVTRNVTFPNNDPDPADLVEMVEADENDEGEGQDDDADSDAEDVFDNSTDDDDAAPTQENTPAPAPTPTTTNTLPIFDIAKNEIPDFGDDHFANLEAESVRAMCRLMASAVMSRGLSLSQVQAAIKGASDGTATAITPLTKDQAVALYRAFRLELLKVKA